MLRLSGHIEQINDKYTECMLRTEEVVADFILSSNEKLRVLKIVARV